MRSSETTSATACAAAWGLGLDVGGTHTRWAVASASGDVVSRGQAAPFSAAQWADAVGREAMAAVLRGVASEMAQSVTAVCAGITGFDAASGDGLRELLSQAFGCAAARVELGSDIEIACRCACPPGQGVLLLAGTGSIAAYVDDQDVFHRAGGRGVVIDDAGGGHWIAVQALRQVWRAEDERPGAGSEHLLAQCLFQRLGGSDWSHTRRAVVGATRGEIGRLALAVAEAAQAGDAAARALLTAAGTELARLVLALWARHGRQPAWLAGRVFELGPEVEAGLRAALPPGTPMQHVAQAAEVSAAQRAAQRAERPVARHAA